MSDMRKLLESMTKFAGEPAQRPGDQVRGTEQAKKKKSGQHPFQGRLVGGESIIKELEKQLVEGDVERRLREEFEQFNEFASNSGGGGGNYFRELASAWYNGTFDTGSLQKGIKSQEDVERLLNRGIVCPDGKTRKFHIDYNSDFDGVEIFSDDYYEHGDHDDTIDSRTGQKWGPYDFMAFSDEDLSEGLNEFAPPGGDDGGPDEDEILFRLAKQWWLGTESDMVRVERTLASMGWEIGEDEGSYDNGGVFVVRAGDINGDSYESWPAEDLTEGLTEVDRRGFLRGMGAAAVAGAAGEATAQLKDTAKLAVEVGELDTSTKQYEPVTGQLRNFIYVYDASVFIMKYIDSKGNNISEGEVFRARGPGTDFKNRPNTIYISDKNAVKVVPDGSPDGDLIYFTPRNWIDQKIGWRSVYYQKNLTQQKESVEQGVAEGQLEFNTPDPVVVVQDLKGNILDKINLSVAAQKYKLGAAQNIKNQLAHQNYTTIGNYVIVSPMSGQPQDATTQGVAEGMFGFMSKPEPVKKKEPPDAFADKLDAQRIKNLTQHKPTLADKKKPNVRVITRYTEENVAENEGDPEGLPHLTKELLTNIVDQVGKEGAHAIVKSLTWGDGAAKELLHLIVNDLEDDVQQGLDKQNYKKLPDKITELGANNPPQPNSAAAGTATTAPVDPKATAALKQNLMKLKTSVPGLDITKATAAMTKADTGVPLTPGDKNVTSAIAPELANVMKNPQMASSLKMMIDKANQQEKAAAAKPPGTV